MSHAFKGDRHKDIRVEQPGRASELSGGDGIWTHPGGNEASRKSGEREGVKMLVILGLVRPEKPHEPFGEVVAAGLDRESYSRLMRDLHHRGVGLGVESSQTGDTRDPTVSESREEAYANAVKPTGQGFSVDLTREVSGEATIDQVALRVHLPVQPPVLSRAQPEPRSPLVSDQFRTLKVPQCRVRFYPGWARTTGQIRDGIPHLRHG